MNPRVFREYDIRGNADRDLDDPFVLELGRAIAAHLVADGKKRITLGRDCRVTSPRLHAQIKEGLLSSGIDVIDVGVVATPVLYFSVFHFDTDGGIQITGSHNPPEDNGFKILRGRSTIHGAEIQQLRKRVEDKAFVFAEQRGKYETRDIVTPYSAMVKENIQLGTRRFKIVVDAGNGVGGIGAPILRSLGFDVTDIYCEPDGRFPHHHPDPTVPENVADLIATVDKTGAEVGIAFDGDADRIGVVDSQGRIVWGDQLMILLAREILKEKPGATFVSEVKCSKALYDEVARAGGRAIMWKVGHSLIKEKMKAEGAMLAGEMSGHIFFAHRYYGFDDAIYSAARLIELLSKSDMTLAQHVDTLPKFFNTPEIRFELPDDIKFKVVDKIVALFKQRGENVVDVDGARVTWQDGWALVRASNTQAALVLRFEATTEARLKEIRTLVEGELSRIVKESQ